VSVFRKIMLALLFVTVAGVSSWLRFGDPEALMRWWRNRPAPVAAPVAAPQDETLPIHVGYSGRGTSAADTVMVLHFRRADGADEAMANVVAKVYGPDEVIRKEVSTWAAFRRETPAGASMARIAIGSFPPGSYRVVVDVGSKQTLGIKRAAAEFASSAADPVWVELIKAK
jgi:hypothetical protein